MTSDDTSDQKNKFLNAPEYSKAWYEFFHTATQGIVFQDSVLGMMRREETSHAGPIRNVRSPQLLDQPYTGAQYSASMHEDDIKQTNIEKHTDFICAMAKSAQNEIAPQVFQSLTEMIAASGMDIDAGGKPFSAEMYLRGLEIMDIAFDDEGKPLLPKLICNPSNGEAMKQAVQEAHQSPQYNTILTRKRDEFFAKKRTRRLS